MTNWGLTYIGILITVHTLFFFGGEAGLVDSQTNDNPHKEFVTKFSKSDNLTQSAGVSQDAGIVESTFSPILAQTSFFQRITAWMTSPYSTIDAASFPPMLELLLKALMGFGEAYTIYKAVRGGF